MKEIFYNKPEDNKPENEIREELLAEEEKKEETLKNAAELFDLEKESLERASAETEGPLDERRNSQRQKLNNIFKTLTALSVITLTSLGFFQEAEAGRYGRYSTSSMGVGGMVIGEVIGAVGESIERKERAEMSENRTIVYHLADAQQRISSIEGDCRYLETYLERGLDQMNAWGIERQMQLIADKLYGVERNLMEIKAIERNEYPNQASGGYSSYRRPYGSYQYWGGVVDSVIREGGQIIQIKQANRQIEQGISFGLVDISQKIQGLEQTLGNVEARIASYPQKEKIDDDIAKAKNIIAQAKGTLFEIQQLRASQ